LNEEGALLVDAQGHTGDRTAARLHAHASPGEVIAFAKVPKDLVEAVAHRIGVALLQGEEQARQQLAAVDRLARGRLEGNGRAPQRDGQLAVLRVHVEADADDDPVDRVLLAGHLEQALDIANFGGFEDRAFDASERGKFRGFGIATYVEACAFPGKEGATVILNDNGSATLLIGSLFVLTRARNEAWHSDVALFEAEVAAAPGNPEALLDLEMSYASAGRSDDSLALCARHRTIRRSGWSASS
jgi:hypothetical protein